MTPADIKKCIRHAELTDCGAIASIYNSYLGYSTMDIEAKKSPYYEDILKGLAERERLYVLEVEDDILGWGIIKLYSDRIGYRTTCETSVYLHPDQRGKGYGSVLKNYIIEVCRKLEYHHLVAKIMADNQVSIDYNFKLGYEIVGTQREVGMVGREWKDVVIMQLLL